MSGSYWWESREAMAELWRWLESRGRESDDVSYFISKPWKWDAEWFEMQVEKSGVHAWPAQVRAAADRLYGRGSVDLDAVDLDDYRGMSAEDAAEAIVQAIRDGVKEGAE